MISRKSIKTFFYRWTFYKNIFNAFVFSVQTRRGLTAKTHSKKNLVKAKLFKYSQKINHKKIVSLGAYAKKDLFEIQKITAYLELHAPVITMEIFLTLENPPK